MLSAVKTDHQKLITDHQKMKLIFLGTGTSHGLPYIGCECAVCTSTDPLNKRLRSSIVVESDDGATRILVDTSPDLRQQFLREKISFVSAVLFTHTHNDHIIGLDDLRPVTDLVGYIPVYASEPTMQQAQNIFGYGFLQGREHGGFPRFTPYTIEPRVSFEIADFRITPIPIMHGKSEILAFRFEQAGSTLVYATDCSHIPEESWALMKNPDVFVVDALRHRPHPTHFTTAQAMEAAQKLNAKQTFFTHIAHDLDHAQTQASLPPNISMAYDGLQIAI
jgi:phosphoribosyl 1,2-cyclic phosphate phosphodiesterase